ncbi:hypothetical protein VUR80DRAFT_1709 [Thermomyces stellatus]
MTQNVAAGDLAQVAADRRLQRCGTLDQGGLGRGTQPPSRTCGFEKIITVKSESAFRPRTAASSSRATGKAQEEREHSPKRTNAAGLEGLYRSRRTAALPRLSLYVRFARAGRSTHPRRVSCNCGTPSKTRQVLKQIPGNQTPPVPILLDT